MKCPKCGYLGFEHVERCRNCGYDFLLSRSVAAPELPLRQAPAAEPSPLADLEIVDRSRRVDTEIFVHEIDRDLDRDLDRVLQSPDPLSIFRPEGPGGPLREAAEHESPKPQAPAPATAPPSVAAQASGLPLFSSNAADDAPLISRPSPPRQPLAVRRATPDAARLRAERPRAASMELPLEPKQSDAVARLRAVRSQAAAPVTPEPAHASDLASLSARLAAVAIDGFILVTIDLAVIYFTLQICAVSLSEMAIIPKAPLLAFLIVQNFGYLVAFTAGGQTLGKMAAGIRVVTKEGAAHLDIGRAMLRTLLWVVLPGLHDRFAGTRVVRASA